MGVACPSFCLSKLGGYDVVTHESLYVRIKKKKVVQVIFESQLALLKGCSHIATPEIITIN